MNAPKQGAAQRLRKLMIATLTGRPSPDREAVREAKAEGGKHGVLGVFADLGATPRDMVHAAETLTDDGYEVEVAVRPKLTSNQARALDAMVAHYVEHLRPPTGGELADALHLTRGGVRHYVEALESLGYVADRVPVMDACGRRLRVVFE